MEKWYWFWGKDQNNLKNDSLYKSFTNFNTMKLYSAQHSKKYKEKYPNYWSDYIKNIELNFTEQHNELDEKILCSAVWYKDLISAKDDLPLSHYLPKNIDKGIVMYGLRHAQCIYTRVALNGKKDFECGESIQGFLTNCNNFLTREEAARLHVKNGGKLNYSSTDLYSEDLY
jgi:hypothetical protein